MPTKQNCESTATSFLCNEKELDAHKKRKHRRSLAASFCNEVLHAPQKKRKKKKECEAMATSFHNEVLLTHKTRNMNSCTSF
jgi:hypothetical protein